MKLYPIWRTARYTIGWYYNENAQKNRPYILCGTSYIEYPTIYENGTVGYNSPERIPHYVKQTFHHLLNCPIFKEQEGTYYPLVYFDFSKFRPDAVVIAEWVQNLRSLKSTNFQTFKITAK